MKNNGMSYSNYNRYQLMILNNKVNEVIRIAGILTDKVLQMQYIMKQKNFIKTEHFVIRDEYPIEIDKLPKRRIKKEIIVKINLQKKEECITNTNNTNNTFKKKSEEIIIEKSSKEPINESNLDSEYSKKKVCKDMALDQYLKKFLKKLSDLMN